MKAKNCKMQNARYKLLIVVAGVSALLPSLLRAATFTFDDIDFWVGTGDNRAALVIDWVEANTDPPALAWGYRWDGAATGYDMLRTIVEADDRLFAKLGEFDEGTSLFGLGYDVDNDGQFGALKINGAGQPIQTLFDAAGIAVSGIPDQDGRRALATDPGDYYAEGWFTAVWHYGNEVEMPVGTPTNPYDGGSWKDNGSGMLLRNLKNRSWDSWAYEVIPPTPPFNLDSYAENPVAAAAPFLPGDYNRDHHVNDLDYQLWKSDFGSTNSPAVDGNGNGVVDAADYTIWRNHVGLGAGSWAAGDGVPEPTSLWFTLSSVFVLWLASGIRRKENVS
jgi:hypothetical protein